jgi:hypothetical protein
MITMASDAANDITEFEMAALAVKFASWAGELPQREQEILRRVMHATAAAEDDTEGYAAPPFPVPGWRMPPQGSPLVPSDPPKDWNREADFSSAFLYAFGRSR